jgi:Conjugal transfer protein
MRILRVQAGSKWTLGVSLPTALIVVAATADANARGRDHGRGDAVVAAVASTDSVRLPYNRGKVYQVRLLPGAPFALELPAGESVKNLWFDNRWWAAETTPGASRVFLRAIGASDVVGRTGFIHIETEPSDLRLSLRAEAVEDAAEIPAALEIYVEGSALNDPSQRQMRKTLDRELVYVQKHAEDAARTQFEAWRKSAMVNLRGDEAYDRGGDFRINRVVDDHVQTFISISNASDTAVIQFVDKSGHAELVNYELENGTYVVQNKVLRPGEKFRLVLGKEQGWVALK